MWSVIIVPVDPPLQEGFVADNTFIFTGDRALVVGDPMTIHVNVANAETCHFTNNDYTQTQAPGLAANGFVYDGVLGLFNCFNCKVKEKPALFPSATPKNAGNYISVLGGSNRVIGDAANESPKPAGIGDIMRERAKQSCYDKGVAKQTEW